MLSFLRWSKQDKEYKEKLDELIDFLEENKHKILNFRKVTIDSLLEKGSSVTSIDFSLIKHNHNENLDKTFLKGNVERNQGTISLILDYTDGNFDIIDVKDKLDIFINGEIDITTLLIHTDTTSDSAYIIELIYR